MNIARWITRRWQTYGPARRLKVLDGDALPLKMPRRDLVLTRDDGDDWSVGMRCPCGCGDTIELMILDEARPRWDIEVDSKRRPTLRPSVWRQTGCRSHFWVRRGQIIWCD